MSYRPPQNTKQLVVVDIVENILCGSEFGMWGFYEKKKKLNQNGESKIINNFNQ